MAKNKAEPVDEPETLEPGEFIPGEGYTPSGRPLRRRDPSTLPPLVSAEPAPPGHHKPVHLFTAEELAAQGRELPPGVSRGTQPPAEVAPEPAKPALSMATPPARIEAIQPARIDDISTKFLAWATEYVGQHGGTAPAIIQTDAGLGAPLVFIPTARGGKFGCVLEVRRLPEDADPRAAARQHEPLTAALRSLSAAGYWCAVANGDPHARDLVERYFSYEPTAGY